MGDCIEKVFSRCDVRNTEGDCVDKYDCEDECAGPGYRIDNVGACECQNLTELDNSCDATCRANQIIVEVKSGNTIEVTDPTDDLGTILIDLDDYPEYDLDFSEVSCPSGSDCSITSVSFGDGGMQSGYYPAE